MSDNRSIPNPLEGYTAPSGEKELLMAFMGQQYGAVKKMDDDIISASNSLKRNTERIAQQFKTVAMNAKPPAPIEDKHIPPEVSRAFNLDVTPGLPAPIVLSKPVQQPPPPPLTQPQEDDNQLMFEFDKQRTVQELYDKLSTIEDSQIAIKGMLRDINKMLKDDKTKNK